MSGKLAAFGVAALLLVGVPVGCSYLNSLNAVATAPARVITRTMNTGNILHNYEKFFDLNAQFNARVGQIASMKSDLETAEGEEKNTQRMELRAVQQTCRDLVQQYNADSQKQNQNLFKARNLPYQLDVTNCN